MYPSNSLRCSTFLSKMDVISKMICDLPVTCTHTHTVHYSASSTTVSQSDDVTGHISRFVARQRRIYDARRNTKHTATTTTKNLVRRPTPPVTHYTLLVIKYAAPSSESNKVHKQMFCVENQFSSIIQLQYNNYNVFPFSSVLCLTHACICLINEEK